MKNIPSPTLILLLISLLLISCTPPGAEVPQGGDPGYPEVEHLPLGEMEEAKADVSWVHAKTCKTVPSLPQLQDPHVVISLNGLTLRLKDRASGFEKVFPIGIGKVNYNRGETTYQQSLSYYPILKKGTNNFTMNPSRSNPCTIWWYDRQTGRNLPVFAGMPFLSWHGSYGIHGPISQYWIPSGGKLQRGYVSHGCIRMEAADILEFYGRIKTRTSVPVRVQKAIERRTDGSAVDIQQKWILSECTKDAECNFQGGYCKHNPYSTRGFCTAACSRYCNYDKYGYPVTFCVEDGNSGEGYCTYKHSSFNYSCRGYDSFKAVDDEPRINYPAITADVCLPGSSGWIGDRCLADTDCMSGKFCEKFASGQPGFCTEGCSKYCPDMSGHYGTFCINHEGAGRCTITCDPASNGARCGEGFTCAREARYSQSWVQKHVCVPK